MVYAILSHIGGTLLLNQYCIEVFVY